MKRQVYPPSLGTLFCQHLMTHTLTPPPLHLYTDRQQTAQTFGGNKSNVWPSGAPNEVG